MAIEKVVYVEAGDLNVNSSRIISTIMGGKSNEFEPVLVRAIKATKDGLIGGHWREYPEVWGFIGSGKIILEDIDTKERREYLIRDSSRIFIPARVASKLDAIEGTFVVTCSPASADRVKQTHEYEIK